MTGPAQTQSPYRPPELETLAWVLAQREASRVVRIERLVGGITADVDRLELGRTGGGSEQVVLRRWTGTAAQDDVATAGLVEREAAALTALAASAVPAPRLLAADGAGTQAGVRCLLMSALPGRVELTPPDLDTWVGELAQRLAEIHAVPPILATRSEGWFEPEADRSWLADTGLARAALEATLTPGAADDVFVHGDFQPFNVLWRPGRAESDWALCGVVDWPNAGTGPRGVDVGHCVLNLAVLASADVAQAFLRHYEVAAGVRVDPSARLRALLSWDLDWQRFIPVQVAGRASVDVDGMAQRVTETIRRTLP